MAEHPVQPSPNACPTVEPDAEEFYLAFGIEAGDDPFDITGLQRIVEFRRCFSDGGFRLHFSQG